MTNTFKTTIMGLYLLLFLCILVIIPIITYFSSFNDSLIKALIYIGCAGGLGGLTYCIRGFYQRLVDGSFDFKWTWWYIYRPFLSIVIGVIIYFLIFGGLIGIGPLSLANFAKSTMFYCALAYLAGFSFTQFANKLEELAETLFSTKKEDKK